MKKEKKILRNKLRFFRSFQYKTTQEILLLQELKFFWSFQYKTYNFFIFQYPMESLFYNFQFKNFKTRWNQNLLNLFE